MCPDFTGSYLVKIVRNLFCTFLIEKLGSPTLKRLHIHRSYLFYLITLFFQFPVRHARLPVPCNNNQYVLVNGNLSIFFAAEFKLEFESSLIKFENWYFGCSLKITNFKKSKELIKYINKNYKDLNEPPRETRYSYRLRLFTLKIRFSFWLRVFLGIKSGVRNKNYQK